jgi:hypothetical protein
MRRVVMPGGRVFVVDFESCTKKGGGLLAHFHARHGHVGIQDVIAMLVEAGLNVTKSGALGIRDFALCPCERPEFGLEADYSNHVEPTAVAGTVVTGTRGARIRWAHAIAPSAHRASLANEVCPRGHSDLKLRNARNLIANYYNYAIRVLYEAVCW